MFGSITNLEGDLFDQFNRLHRELEDFWGTARGPASIRAVAHGSYPSINIGSTPEGVEVYVFAPGLDKESLDLSVQQGLLTVSGKVPEHQPEGTTSYLKERFSGEFKRSLSLPEDIDPETARANYRNGVLQISLRRKAESRPRKIEIH